MDHRGTREFLRTMIHAFPKRLRRVKLIAPASASLISQRSVGREISRSRTEIVLSLSLLLSVNFILRGSSGYVGTCDVAYLFRAVPRAFTNAER